MPQPLNQVPTTPPPSEEYLVFLIIQNSGANNVSIPANKERLEFRLASYYKEKQQNQSTTVTATVRVMVVEVSRWQTVESPVVYIRWNTWISYIRNADWKECVWSLECFFFKRYPLFRPHTLRLNWRVYHIFCGLSSSFLFCKTSSSKAPLFHIFLFMATKRATFFNFRIFQIENATSTVSFTWKLETSHFVLFLLLFFLFSSLLSLIML